MRKMMLLGVTVAVVLAVFAGTALAVNKMCTSGHTCRGTNEPDGLTGTKYADRIIALGGDDIVYAHGGADKITGGEGNDFLRGDNGKDTIRGQQGIDSVIGNNSNDTLLGDDTTATSGDAPDNVAGGAGNDIEQGNAGGDLLGNITFGANDTVYDTGEDQLSGGPGNDTFYTSDGQTDSIDCGPGTDTVYKDPQDTLVHPSTCEEVYNKVDNGARTPAGAAAPGSFQQSGKAISGS